MSANSKIEWTDHTFNPWIGCTKVSPGCAHCYAESEDKRRGWTEGGWGKGKPRKRTSAANWKQPLKWNREAALPLGDSIQAACPVEIPGPRPRVFCASLADWLDDEVPIEWLADLLALIHATPHLDWLLLTKRPENWQSRLLAAYDFADQQARLNGGGFVGEDGSLLQWLDRWRCAYTKANGKLSGIPWNVWIGTSVEDQQRADDRIPALLKIPARIRFLSCEPLLGAVGKLNWLPGDLRGDSKMQWTEAVNAWPGIHWIIIGGESGHGARACDVQWIRSLVAQCKAAGVAAFVKQLGAKPVCECSRAVGSYSANCCEHFPLPVRDRKGGDWNEWPEDLRVREFPKS